MRRIALLADLHFGAEDPALVAPLARDVQEACPDVLAVAGDLTKCAHPAEFAAAATFLHSLDLPMVVVPGNHDIPGANLERFLDPLRTWRRTFMDETEGVWADEEIALLGLNTVCRAALRADWSAGRVTPGRLARLAARAAAFPGRRLLVVAHHPFRHPLEDWRRGHLARAEAAVQAFSALGAQAVLSGHLHRPSILVGPGAPDLVLTGTPLCPRRPRGTPNAWTLVESRQEGLRVEHRAYVDGRFRPWISPTDSVA